MPTERQISANRRNANRSTGPRTADGKRRSSANALKHGALAFRLLLPGEEPAEFDTFARQVRRAFRPHTSLQKLLLPDLVGSLWAARRYMFMEAEVLRGECLRVERQQQTARLRELQGPGQESKSTSRKEALIELKIIKLGAQREAFERTPAAAFARDAAGPNVIGKLIRYARMIDRRFERLLAQYYAAPPSPVARRSIGPLILNSTRLASGAPRRKGAKGAAVQQRSRKTVPGPGDAAFVDVALEGFSVSAGEALQEEDLAKDAANTTAAKDRDAVFPQEVGAELERTREADPTDDEPEHSHSAPLRTDTPGESKGEQLSEPIAEPEQLPSEPSLSLPGPTPLATSEDNEHSAVSGSFAGHSAIAAEDEAELIEHVCRSRISALESAIEMSDDNEGSAPCNHLSAQCGPTAGVLERSPEGAAEYRLPKRRPERTNGALSVRLPTAIEVNVYTPPKPRIHQFGGRSKSD